MYGPPPVLKFCEGKQEQFRILFSLLLTQLSSGSLRMIAFLLLLLLFNPQTFLSFLFWKARPVPDVLSFGPTCSVVSCVPPGLGRLCAEPGGWPQRSPP